MKEIVRKIVDQVGIKALNSVQAFEEAAADLGYSKEETAEIIQDFDGSLIDDDDLDAVAGGRIGQTVNITFN